MALNAPIPDAVKVVVVFAISCESVAKLSEEYCHLTTLPVFPDKDKVVELVPVQTEVPPVTLPPTDKSFTVIVALALFEEGQVPFVITAL